MRLTFVVTQLRRLWLVLAAAVLTAGVVLPAAAQQTGTLQGQLTDAVTGEALVGARVVVVGTDVEARSSVQGRYVLENVPAGRVRVQVLMVGYASMIATTTVPAGQSTDLDFTLRRLALELEAVIVTGTAGEVRRRQIGNSISNISAAQLEDAPVTSLDEVLRGRAVGAVVNQNIGQVGGGASVSLRGQTSIMMGNNPLIYIDGVRVNSNFAPQSDEVGNAVAPALDINPEDIDRVEVVKGAAATTLYGTEASTGVIQIFTKRGSSGSPAWTFTTDQGFRKLGHVGPRPDDAIIPDNELARSYAATGLFLNDCRESDPIGCPESGTYLRNGYAQRYTLSVRGGTEQSNYYFSGKWASENGVIAPQGTDDWAVRGNFGFRPSETLQLQYNSSYSHRDIRWIPDGDNAEGFLLNVFRRENGYTTQDNDLLALEMRLDQVIDHYVTGLNFQWLPGAGVRQRVNVGVDWQRSEYTEERPFGYFRQPDGDRENDTYQTRTLTLDYAGTWETEVGSSFTSSFSWGGQLYETIERRLNGFGDDFGLPGRQKDIDAAAQTEAFETKVDLTSGGFFFQEMIGFKDRLFLTGGVRFDGFSTFGEDFGITSYPKVSLSYILSDHEFWPDWWDNLKLRAALGWSGRAPGTFDATRTWDAVSGDDGQPAVTPSNPGDPELGPERTREFEIGAEGTLLGGRATFEYTYYDQTTSDALVGVQQVPSQGFTGLQLKNVGEIRNWGHETAVNVTILPSTTFNWEVGVRYSNNQSEAVDLGGQILPLRGAAAVEIREGFPVPGVFGPVLKDPDAVGVGAIDRCTVPENRAEFEADPDACGFKGPNFPVWTYGLSTRFTIGRRLTLDALGEGQGGHYISQGTARQTVRRAVWPECVGIRELVLAGDVAGLTAEQQALCARSPTFIDWARSANFFRMRHITLSYRLPERWLPGPMRRAVVSVAGKNLFLIAPDFRGLDPEALEDPTTAANNSSNAGVGFRYSYYNMPVPRQFVASLRIDF